MSITPIVRYMLLCDDWRFDGPGNRRITIVGLMWTIHSYGEPPFPCHRPEFHVFLALTECRGKGEGQIVCVYEETGERIYESRKRPLQFQGAPFEVVGVPFRITDCIFPYPGLYMVQFWYDDVMVEERPLRLR